MIYLIKSYLPLGKYIYKVGFTDNMIRRCNHYFYTNPGFEIVSTREGDEILEKLLHYYLYHKGFQYKKNGKLDEWFLGNTEVRNIFHYSREKIEKELWKHREEIFNPGGSSTDYKLFEYLYQKNKEDFIGEKYIVDEYKKVRETSAKDIDIIFWEMYFLKNNSDIRGGMTDIKSISDKIVSDFLREKFYSTGFFHIRMKMYCEFCDLYKDNQDIMSSLDHKIKDSKYKGFYTFYGTSGCSAKDFREIELIRGYKNDLKGDKLKTLIYSNFKTGDRYTSKDIKQKLHEIYNILGISKTPKATDLGNYFTLVKTKITLQDKSLSNGFRLDLL